MEASIKPLFSSKDLVKLMIPLVLELLLASAIGFADTLMVTNVGEATVSGVSIVDTINVLLNNIFTAFATGGTIIVSQMLGQGDNEKGKNAANQVFIATFSISALLMAAALIFNRQILSLIYGNIAEDVMSSAVIYFYITALSYPFLAQYNSCAAFFRAQGDAMTPLVVSVIMNLINVGGNALFIFGFGLGAAGAALGTLLSRVFGAIVIYILIRKPKLAINLSELFPLKIDRQVIKRVFTLGLPIGIENGVFQIGKIMVQGYVTGFGTMAIAANAVANSLGSIAVMPAMAMGMGLITVVGRCIGAGEKKQAKSYSIKITLVAHASTIVVAILVLVFMDGILGIYGLSDETAALARKLLICGSVAPATVWAEAFVLPNALKAANDVKFSMIVSMISMWTMRVGMGYVLAYPLGIGVVGIWGGMLLDWIVRCVCFGWRFLSGRWLKFSE